MTDQAESPKPKISIANVKKKSKGFSPVWVIPIVAALVGGWMVFQNLLEEKVSSLSTYQKTHVSG